MFIALDHIVLFDHILHVYVIPKPLACLTSFLWKKVSFKLAKIQRWPCILLSVDFTLHKTNLLYVLNMPNFYMFR